jgi:hypothetical protein
MEAMVWREVRTLDKAGRDGVGAGEINRCWWYGTLLLGYHSRVPKGIWSSIAVLSWLSWCWRLSQLKTFARIYRRIKLVLAFCFGHTILKAWMCSCSVEDASFLIISGCKVHAQTSVPLTRREHSCSLVDKNSINPPLSQRASYICCSILIYVLL